MKISRYIPDPGLFFGVATIAVLLAVLWIRHGIPETGLASNFTGRADVEAARQLAILKRRVMGGRKADEAKLSEASPPQTLFVSASTSSAPITMKGVKGITFPKSEPEELPAQESPSDKMVGGGSGGMPGECSWTTYQRANGSYYIVRATAEELKKARESWQAEEQRRRDLFQALRTRVLTDAERKEALGYGDRLNLEAFVSYYAADKTRELNEAWRSQNLMMIAASAKGLSAPTAADIMDSAFETGAKLGYCAALSGGKNADLLFIIERFKARDSRAVDQWFKEHDGK